MWSHAQIPVVSKFLITSVTLIDAGIYDCSFSYGYFHSDPHQSSGQILASKFSPSGSLFAVCDDYKQLTVWEKKTGWETVSSR